MIRTVTKNKVKPDTILKNFWKDNARFADLFNAILFNGENVIKPEELEEADTDLSTVLKFNSHADTLQKVLDVVKKSAHGVDFVILGLENQQKVHYGMPLRARTIVGIQWSRFVYTMVKTYGTVLCH